MRYPMHFLVLFASLAVLVRSDCRHGDAHCHKAVGPASWCRREDFTCQGKPQVKCTCDPPSEAPHKHKPKQNHQICIDRVGPSSWCREDLTCQGRPDIKCGGDTPTVAAKAASVAEPKPKAATTTSGPVAAKRTSVDVAPAVVPVAPGALNHSICTAIDPGSWCKENGFCHRHDSVPCRGGAPAAPVLRRRSEEPTEAPAAARVVPRRASASAASSHGGLTNNMILWTEWPTLDIGAWPEYFAQLREFLTDNCGGFRFNRVIMRVLDPTFQRERGQLWQVSRRSSFYVDFLRHLGPGIEVHIYPYLLERESALAWTSGHGSEVESALEGAFKYVRDWNRILIDDGLPARLGGVVCDKEEGRNFLHDLEHLARLKRTYSIAGAPRPKFGLGIGFDTTGSIPSFSEEIDNFYVEMYDWYVPGHRPVRKITAEKYHAVNNPARFVEVLETIQNLVSHYHRYREHDRIVFMWSLQNSGHRHCLYPLNDGTCGERQDFGSWTPGHFRDFLSALASRESVFAQRQHALFQFSYVPHTWHPRSGCA